MYRVEVAWAPAFELLASLKAYVNRREHQTLDLGAGWVKEVRGRLTPELTADLTVSRVFRAIDLFDLLAWQCPGEPDSEGFLEWVRALSLGDLYERVAPSVLRSHFTVPNDLEGTRQWYLHLLAAWDEQYFGQVDPAILAGLRADAAAKTALITGMAPDDLVEMASNGVQIAPELAPEVVLLVPQYHYRPWNLFSYYRNLVLLAYPADALPLAAGEPSTGLLRLTRALSDPSRLRILRLLSDDRRSFTQLVMMTGLAKSTVHHHMVALRAAGLVRVNDVGGKTVTYQLRPDAADDLGNRLRAYLTPSDE